MPQQPSQGEQPSGNRLPFLLVALLQGLAYSVEVIFRSNIGERRCRQMALPLALTLGAALLFTVYVEQKMSRPPVAYPSSLSYPSLRVSPPPRPALLFYDGGWQLGPYPMFGFCLISLVRHLYQRYCAWRRRFQGAASLHTYYDGTPNAFAHVRWFGLSEVQAKRWLEPAFLVTFGAGCVAASVTSLGCYWIAAGLAIHLTVTVRLRQEREQALDATDAVHDMMNHQEAIAAEYQPRECPPPAPRVVASVEPAPRRRPDPPAPRTPTINVPTVAVPSRLREGLDDNLQQLLDEPHVEE